LPAGGNLNSFLDRNTAELGDFTCYRYLDYTRNPDGESIELTGAELGTRLRAIGARLQQVTSPGDRVAILAPQGLDYVVDFFAAVKAGNIAVRCSRRNCLGLRNISMRCSATRGSRWC
jgi:fatty-acyl-CoA synthase